MTKLETYILRFIHDCTNTKYIYLCIYMHCARLARRRFCFFSSLSQQPASTHRFWEKKEGAPHLTTFWFFSHACISIQAFGICRISIAWQFFFFFFFWIFEGWDWTFWNILGGDGDGDGEDSNH